MSKKFLILFALVTAFIVGAAFSILLHNDRVARESDAKPQMTDGGFIDPNGIAEGSGLDPHGVAEGSGLDPYGLAEGSHFDPNGLAVSSWIDPMG